MLRIIGEWVEGIVLIGLKGIKTLGRRRRPFVYDL
jgi:hypothetical protein